MRRRRRPSTRHPGTFPTGSIELTNRSKGRIKIQMNKKEIKSRQTFPIKRHPWLITPIRALSRLKILQRAIRIPRLLRLIKRFTSPMATGRRMKTAAAIRKSLVSTSMSS